MALTASRKQAIGLWLLGGSMLPLLFEHRSWGWEPTTPPVWAAALWTAGLCLWARWGGRASYVLVLLRASVHVLGGLFGIGCGLVSGFSEDALVGQFAVSLLIAGAALWLLARREVARLSWQRTRAPAAWATGRVLRGLVLGSVVLGTAEQALLHEHLSALELAMRALYLALPVSAAWLAARRSGRLFAITIAAFFGDLAGDLVSQIVSGPTPDGLVWTVLMPVGAVPALLPGAVLARLATSGGAAALALGMALSWAAYREGSCVIATGGVLPGIGLALSAATGTMFGLIVWRWRGGAGAVQNRTYEAVPVSGTTS